MSRAEWGWLAGILAAAALLIGIGFDTGLPSETRLRDEAGGAEAVTRIAPELRAFLATGVMDRSEFLGYDEGGGRARFSPFFDQLRTYSPDEGYILKTLSRMVRDRDVIPRSYIYPPFFFYQVGTVLGAAHVVGLVPRPVDTVSLLSRPGDAAKIYRAGRWSSMLALLGGLVAVFLAGRAYGGVRCGLFATALCASLPLLLLTGKFIKPDAGCFLWSTLSLWLAIRAWRTGAWRDYLAAGAMVGLAAAVKYPGGLTASALAGYSALRMYEFRKTGAWRSEVYKLCAAGAVSAAAFLLVNFPIFADWKNFLHDFVWIAGVLEDRSLLNVFGRFLFCFTFDGVFFHLGLAAVLFGWWSVGASLWHWRAGYLPLLAMAGLYFLMASRGRTGSDAYLVPGLAPLAILGAAQLLRLKRGWLRYGILGAVVLNGVVLMYAVDRAAALENVRILTTRRLRRLYPDGATVGRWQYPVGYRTAGLPPERYGAVDFLRDGTATVTAKAACVVDSSFEDWSSTAQIPGRLEWLRGGFAPRRPFAPCWRLLEAPTPPGCLWLSVPRRFMASPYLDTIAPTLMIWVKSPPTGGGTISPAGSSN